jgi:hypothetical protein
MYAIGNRSDVPAVLAMAAFFFSFGLFAILRPAALRNAMDNFANAWKQGSLAAVQNAPSRTACSCGWHWDARRSAVRVHRVYDAQAITGAKFHFTQLLAGEGQ